MRYIETISKTDLARHTRQVVDRARRGGTIIVESYGEEQVVVIDAIDYRILRAVAAYQSLPPHPAPINDPGLEPSGLTQAQIERAVPQARVTALRQAVTLRMEMVGQLMRFSWALSAVVLVIGGLVVLTTMLGSVSERKQEIGVLRAIGFRRRHIVNVILTEATLVSVLGGVLGWLVGMGIAVYIPRRRVQ